MIFLVKFSKKTAYFGEFFQKIRFLQLEMDGVKSLRMKGFLRKHLKESRTCNMKKNHLKRAQALASASASILGKKSASAGFWRRSSSLASCMDFFISFEFKYENKKH